MSCLPYALCPLPLSAPKSFNAGRAYPCSIAATSRSVVSISEIASRGNGDSRSMSITAQILPHVHEIAVDPLAEERDLVAAERARGCADHPQDRDGAGLSCSQRSGNTEEACGGDPAGSRASGH